jgi:hypothetical protein
MAAVVLDGEILAAAGPPRLQELYQPFITLLADITMVLAHK